MIPAAPVGSATASLSHAVDPQSGAPGKLGRGATLAMATTCGVAVATIYFIQPLLGVVTQSFSRSPIVGSIPVLTQLGYAAGVVLLAPLGDAIDRRRLILLQLAGLCVALVGASLAPSALWLAVASLLIGFTATAAQQIVPLAAALAAPSRRGAVVGAVMSGLLCGILFSRTLAGFVAVHFGWRAVFLLAAPLVLGVTAWIARVLTRRAPETSLRYGELLRSVGTLWLEEPELRRAALTQATLFAAFSIFWTILALHLAESRFGLGADVAGLFGLVGAAGVGAAAFVGRVADRRGPRTLVLAGAALVLVAWIVFGLWNSLWGLAAGVIVLDLGVQGAMVANQSIIYALRDDARSRVNTAFMGVLFTGGSLGSALAIAAWRLDGWRAVSLLGVVVPTIGIALQLMRRTTGQR